MNRRQLMFGGSALAAAVPAIAATAAAPASANRISCEKGDPGERLYAELCGDRKHAKVYLDGVLQDECVTADPGLGMVKRAVVTERGNIALNRSTGEIFYETVFGVVRWEAVRF